MATPQIGNLLTEQILKELDLLWPDRAPAPSLADREILIQCAKRDVINVLWAKFREATQNVLKQDLL